MKDLFIHKPVGKTISKETVEKIANKFYGYWQFILKKKSEANKDEWVWTPPEKITFKSDIAKADFLFGEDVELILHCCTLHSPKEKITNFFIDENDRENSKDEWVMGLLPAELDCCIEDSWANIKTDFNQRTEQRTLIDFVLKHLSNFSIANTLKFLNKDQKVNSVIVNNGVVQAFFVRGFVENGVKFSNLSFEDDIPEKQVTLLSTLLAWKKFEENQEINIKEEFEKIKSEPHRLLKKMMAKIGAENFLKTFS